MVLMKLTSERLTLTEGDDDLNVALLVPTILQEIANVMMQEVMLSQRLAVVEIDEVNFNWSLAFAGSANVIPDFLRATYPELYGEDGPATVGYVSDYIMLEFDGKPQAAILAPIVTNGERLFRLATERSLLSQIIDARTPDEVEVIPDNQWATMTVLKILQSRMVPDDRSALLLRDYIRPHVAKVIHT